MEQRIIEVHDLGMLGYQAAWALQKRAQQELIDEKLRNRAGGPAREPALRDLLLFVEHPHVYTLGKSGDRSHMLLDSSMLQDIDAEFVPIDRGGDITYHGPGQIVGYPILDLEHYMTDIHLYLRTLEEVVIRTCRAFGIEAGRVEGLTGVWADGRKVCAMGIRCSRWVTMHGFALNVQPDLGYFDHIVPCGIRDRSVTSLAELAATAPDPEAVKIELIRNMSDLFEATCLRAEDLPESEVHFSYLSTVPPAPAPE